MFQFPERGGVISCAPQGIMGGARWLDGKAGSDPPPWLGPGGRRRRRDLAGECACVGVCEACGVCVSASPQPFRAGRDRE